jgi:hypothetical protein
VVIALVLPEPALPELEPVEPEEFEPEVPEPEVVEPEEADPELVAPDEPVVDATVVLALWARAGSWPDTSWTKITPHTTANVAAAVASARLRIKVTRRRRAFSRAATPTGASGCLCPPEPEDVVEVSLGVIFKGSRSHVGRPCDRSKELV